MELPHMSQRIFCRKINCDNTVTQPDATVCNSCLEEDNKNRKYTAASALKNALGHMEDRASSYDAPQGERSMGTTVAAFNAITGKDLSEEQGWLMMVLLKAVRSQQGKWKQDNYEDGAAYFALAAESAKKERVPK